MSARSLAFELLPKKIPNPDGGPPTLEDRNFMSRMALLALHDGHLAETKGDFLGFVRGPRLLDYLRQETGRIAYEGVSNLHTRWNLIETAPGRVDEGGTLRRNTSDVWKLTDLGVQVAQELVLAMNKAVAESEPPSPTPTTHSPDDTSKATTPDKGTKPAKPSKGGKK
jgi:hypothetical protein